MSITRANIQETTEADIDALIAGSAKEALSLERRGRIFIDYLRNGQGSTAICPWSTRARDGATCAIPVNWDELAHFAGANVFDVFTAARRAQELDCWGGYFDVEKSLSIAIRKAVRKPI